MHVNGLLKRPLFLLLVLVLAGLIPARAGFLHLRSLDLGPIPLVGDAGTDSSVTLCSNGLQVQLFDLLGGAPVTGGTWDGPVAHPGTFDPLTDAPGVFTYTVVGPPLETASVTITLNAAPNAGAGGAIAVCSDEAVFDLANSLGGGQDPGGVWTYGGVSVSNLFTPGVSNSGTYTYTVDVPFCASATADVVINVSNVVDAGLDTSLNICGNVAPFDLFTTLAGTPDPTGAWTLSGLSVDNMFTPGTSLPGIYVYTVNGSPPCPNATANVTVNVVDAPDPGFDRSITVCSNASTLDLFLELGGTPDPGGIWAIGDGTFTPGTDLPGAYRYVVLGNAPCANDTAAVTVTVQAAPNAGLDDSLAVCSNEPLVDLFSVFDVTPDFGGTWTLNNVSVDDQFVPGTDPAGDYIYHVAGQASCLADSSIITVVVIPKPLAGTSVGLAICSDASPFMLLDTLGGTPESTGTWTGPGSLPFPSGEFIPGVTVPGLYTYTVVGTVPCATATATVTIAVTQAPNAGTDSSRVVCSSDGTFALRNNLGGMPDPVGAWTGPDGPVSDGMFIPGSSSPGDYTYLVSGTSPCGVASATVTVTVVQGGNAGSNGSVTVCSSGTPEDLWAALGGSPDGTGTWTGPLGFVLADSLYDPASLDHLSGIQTYTVTPAAPCPVVTATVLVVENEAPEAGSEGSTMVCSSSGSFDMGSILGGTPDAGGQWIDINNAVVPSGFVPGTTAEGSYRYVVTGSAPCLNDTSTASIQVSQAPLAGTNASIVVCSDQATFALDTVLGGTPDAGGSWHDPYNAISDGTYTPGAAAIPGGYTYTVPGVSPCADATAVVTVTERQKPTAGTPGSLQLCSTDPDVDLFLSIGSSPDAGGIWTDPDGTVSSGVFHPTIGGTFIYTYKLTGVAPCAADSTTVTVEVTQAPSAGTSGGLTACSDQTSMDLFDGLGGLPDLNGTWNDDDNTGRLSSNFFTPSIPTPLPAGDYHFTYTVPANGLCPSQSATVTVTVVGMLDAGSNGSISVCGSEIQVNLFTGLGGAPQQGGIWYDLDNTGAVNGSSFNANGSAGPGTYQFKYRLTGTLNCPADSAVATITVVAAPFAGNDATATLCSVGSPVALNLYLPGAQPNGVWRKPAPGSAIFNGIYDPSTFTPGAYTYTKNGTPPCADDVATVTVSETTGPDAGSSSLVTVCSDGDPFNMTALLGGTPDTTGTWAAPDLSSHGAIHTPGLDPSGLYLYTVAGTFPCSNATSTLTVNVNAASFAGADASKTVCSTAEGFTLFSLIAASGAQNNGYWLDPAHLLFPTGYYVPGTSPPGTYTYHVDSLPFCSPDEASVTIFEIDAPDAGMDSIVALCPEAGTVPLVTMLGGTPDPTGTWVGPAPLNAYFSGNFVPGSSGTGTYTYTVPGIPPCASDAAIVSVNVNAAPNAGDSRNITVCSSSGIFIMIDSLGGAPAFNGNWTIVSSGVPHNGIFNSNVTPGVYAYQYTVAGMPPCANDVSTLTITVNGAPNAGTNGSVTLCSNAPLYSLFNALGGAPMMGGSWPVGPANGLFDPAVDTSGTYPYVVVGGAICGNDTAYINVVVNKKPDAGLNGSLSICGNDPTPFLLRDVLGSPQLGGTWTLNGTPVIEVYLTTAYTAGVHTFIYTIPGPSQCPADSAQATIIQYASPNAGSDASTAACTNGANIDLFTLLGGADPGGVWLSAAGLPLSGTFIPSAYSPGIWSLRYIVAGNAPCISDTSTVTITLNQRPNAGLTTIPLICSNGPLVPLLSLLGGTPDATGYWMWQPAFGAPVPHGPTLDPSNDPAGAYIYTVSGTAPCMNASATVQVTLVPKPNAGLNGDITTCASATQVNLFAGLNGTPTAGGYWLDDDLTGQLANGIFDPSGLPPAIYHFTYVKVGTAPCGNDSAMVSVTVTDALDAGDDSNADLCTSQTNVDLFNLLAGTPQPGGQWTAVGTPAGLLNGVLNAYQAGTGVHQYRYVLVGSMDCASDTALLTATILTGPVAGDNGFITICSSSINEVDLFPLLGGTPDPNGTWYYPMNGGAMPSSTVIPATAIAGGYLYVVPAVGSCAADSAVVTLALVTAPQAGSDGTLAFCSNYASQNLGTGLGGMPDPNGTWTYGEDQIAHSNIYDPAIDQPGDYFYTVPAQSPCPSDMAKVVVTENSAPWAGSDNSFVLCSDAAPFAMIDHLAGSPQNGGQWWSGVTPLMHGPVYDPALDSSGTFLYVVTGMGPCVNDSAQLTVIEVEAPNAGVSSTVEICPTGDAFDLFTALGPDADSTGTWSDEDGNLVSNTLFDPAAVVPGTYTFQYLVLAAAPCTDMTSTVTIIVGSGVDPGIGGTDSICGAQVAYDLFNSLDGTPDNDGVWLVQSAPGAITDHFLDATLLVPGQSYSISYTVNDPSCGSVSSVVDMYIADFPDPGGDGAVVVCSTAPAFALFDLITGQPEPGGTWTDPAGIPTDGNFVPGNYSPGVYTYHLLGNAFCGDTSAQVTVEVNPPADAGDPGSLLVCNDETVDLFPVLGGTPQTGGTWSDLDGSGGLTEGTVDVTGVSPAVYHFNYVVEVPGCESDSAIAAITVVDGVTAMDVQRICNDTTRTYVVRFTLVGGDPQGYVVLGGEGSMTDAEPYVFSSAPIFTGEPFSFTADDENHCTPQVVEGESPCTFTDDVFLPQSFTPNGDGINDLFIIPGIEGFPGNTILIFNRWGGLIYEADGYDNKFVAWDGSSPNAVIPGDASTGTYYYVLDLGNGKEPLKGFIYLNR